MADLRDTVVNSSSEVALVQGGPLIGADGRKEQLKLQLKDLILEVTEQKNINPDQIDDNEYLINGSGVLKLESLDAIEISAAIHKKFGVRIKDISSAKQAFRSVNTLTDFILLEQSSKSTSG